MCSSVGDRVLSAALYDDKPPVLSYDKVFCHGSRFP